MIYQEFISNKFDTILESSSYTWQAPSNIALIKYWGKNNHQVPKNSSISFTLNNCHTITTINFERKQTAKGVELDFFFEGKENEQFKIKILNFFERIQVYCPYIFEYKMTINTTNSFPHSSGIASSASGFGAIAMCLLGLESELITGLTKDYIKKKASFLARLGSGSASRSIEGPLMVWGKHSEIKGSSNLFGIKFPYEIHPIFKNYQDTILIVDKGQKQVSSSVGHKLMHGHPFAENRFKQANSNLLKLSNTLQNGDVKEFIKIVESEALTLHAMMLTSTPYFILIKPNTLEIINKIWLYRQQRKSDICFTLDAGANVHVLYPYDEKESVSKFITNDLLIYCEKNNYICDSIGFGAKKINSN